MSTSHEEEEDPPTSSEEEDPSTSSSDSESNDSVKMKDTQTQGQSCCHISCDIIYLQKLLQ